MAGPRDALEVEALVTDRCLESLLALRADASAGAAAFGWEGGDLDRGVRLASLRLRRDLPRFHPSFRFEERLALRLAEASAALHVARAAGAEGSPVPIARARHVDLAELAPPTQADDGLPPPALRSRARPILIGGAVASAAISIAGAAIVAWRRSHHPVSPMARAARAAHAARRGPSRGAHPQRTGAERPG